MARKLALSLLVLGTAAAAVAAVSLAARRAPLGLDRAGPPVVVGLGSLPRLADALPGARASSVLTVENRGRAAADVVLDLTAAGPAPLRRELVLTVARGGRVLYAGPYRPVQRIRLGLLGRGGRQRVSVSVRLRQAAGDGAEGRKVSLAGRLVAAAA